MEVCRRSSWLLLLLGVSLLATALQGVQGEVESEGPSESECRPYIEKALKELETGEAGDAGTPDIGDSKEDVPTVEVTTDDSDHQDGDGDDDTHEEGNASTESVEADQNVTDEQQSDDQEDTREKTSGEVVDQVKSTEDIDTKEDSDDDDDGGGGGGGGGHDDDNDNDDDDDDDGDDDDDDDDDSKEKQAGVPDKDSNEVKQEDDDDSKEESKGDGDHKSEQDDDEDSKEQSSQADDDNQESVEEHKASKEDTDEEKDDIQETQEGSVEAKQTESVEAQPSQENDDNGTKEDTDSKEDDKDDTTENKDDDDSKEGTDDKSTETEASKPEDDDDDSKKSESKEEESVEAKKDDDDDDSKESAEKGSKENGDDDSKGDTESDEDDESAPEEELTLETEIPDELRPRDHVERLLKLDEEASETEAIINRVSEITLRELKKLYENAIKPLEVLYKYRDLSNRHFGDAEIFSKPLILFMGPWSGGKSSIINYLLDNEYNETSLKTGAEPSPAYFNILMYGEEPEIVDGTELAADFTFSGLQKFGQGLEERLKGVKLPNKLLEKVNIVEIPGILEVRKQVSRVFPFNDACQWFIDRADIIFLVYDPSKLDVGPETEAILDQLKGREHQTRIILNKADQVKPEELMRVQGALIWNISPLMSSAQPPVMYTTSLWSKPYESWAPVRLLQAQERAFLRDLRSAVDKRIENKIASARRFAVRVRNHAKMVDCYLTTYYNHKSVFGNRKQVAEEIIDHPQDYHIYEGLSTLTNISRYDLPDPDVYKDFFKLNPLYDFQQLSATCTYFRGCPINRLDIAIAYDLPELVGKHKRLIESALAEANQATVPGS